MARTALCIGINDYPGTGSDLAGCVNDAHDWAEELKGRDFETTIMLDSEATREAMVDAMTRIVTDAKSGDTAVITYSGHGTWQADDDGDEPDFRDEALCPYDLHTVGALLDDDLFEIFAQRARGAHVVFLSDSCHSGSVARFAPQFGDIATPTRFLPPETFLDDKRLDRARKVEKAPAKGLSRGTALLISGCQDLEYSYDASFQGRPNGAFTRAALDTLQDLPADATYRDWHRAIRTVLPSSNYPQTPILTASSSQRKWKALG